MTANRQPKCKVADFRENGNVTNIGRVNIPQTANNSWDTYKVVTGTLNRDLVVGPCILRFTINGAYCNIDKVEFKCTTGIDNVNAEPRQNNEGIYNLMGMKVKADYKGIVIKDGKKVFNK